MIFADTFEFEETPDQQNAIDNVLADMGSNQPMDRLVCGDVGYGKTEVALRAAFKAVISGYQVAILVPTTVLADQHFATFKERFADFPIEVACVSRFYSSAENKNTLAKALSGKVDILIGTHRILQRDVDFKRLGLVVIDEEHRFGVKHKERLKRMRQSVDVLTLTATPIPRTLHMSLIGIRDLSVIETPPVDRQVTRTYVATYDDSIVREAILRELGRNGQVFYINNRVRNIELITAELKDLVPEARIEFAHGQMREKTLEDIMHRFLQGEIDVLVSTTIVESGLDIANANTIIIRRADMFGLAELYQLRGRVGRSSRRAYAYLLVPDPRKLKGEARKRMQVLQSLDDLGVGFRLALQDMEIRGAGNLLGKDQSGHINAVGFELYTRILKDAVREIKNKASESISGSIVDLPMVDPEINVGFPAHIPDYYIPDVAERLLLYQRLVDIGTADEGKELAEEIRDRFGNMPVEVKDLLELMMFRALLKNALVENANYKGGNLALSFHASVELDADKVVALIKSGESKVRVSPNKVVTFEVSEEKVSSPADLSEASLRIFGELGVQTPAFETIVSSEP